MRDLYSRFILVCLALALFGSAQAQETSYPTWKHELQDRLGLEQTGKADRATFDAMVAYLTELDMMDETLEKGYDGMGGYLGFQIYLDNILQNNGIDNCYCVDDNVFINLIKN